MKNISTLVDDLYHVLKTGEGWTDDIAQWVGQTVAKGLTRQMTPRIGSASLRMSNVGTPCERKLWFSINANGSKDKEEMPAHALNKFIFGDIIEAQTLGLVMASGHDLQGMQDTMEVDGIRGSRDCVIDGMLIDVKSVSSQSMSKFINNGLLKDDPFGYLSQLSSYLYAGQNDPLITNKTHAGFLAIDKTLGTINLDVYDLSERIANKKKEFAAKKVMVAASSPPPDKYDPIPDGKSGNMKLATNCSYCDFKKLCFPELQTYIYSTGPRYLTKVVREPNVFKV